VLLLFGLTLLAKGPYSAFLPIAYEPIVVAFGRLHPPALVALVATSGVLLMEWVNYRLFGWALSARPLAKARESRLAQTVVRWFRVAPFAAVWSAALLPAPFGLVRACALLAGYPLGRHLAATALGRLPRYWLCAAVGVAAPVNGLALAALCVALAAVPLVLARPRSRTQDNSAFDSLPEYQPFPDVGRRNLFQERLEIPLMVRALGLPNGLRVLEVGCGRGVALPPLARALAPSRLVGIDVDEGLLAEAKRRVAAREIAAELYPADVRRLPFPAASFDVVIDFGTCYHISRPAVALAEIARVLAPGGVFVHETPLSQLLSHPVRAFGRRLPWHSVPRLAPQRRRLLWSMRICSVAAE
jgi:2-polyprenyl-3-methyl-5-hydroxy-6-metoxy-1,4-benzoquinol methylase/membrane protein YqaA with SNARE-associated domain